MGKTQVLNKFVAIASEILSLQLQWQTFIFHIRWMHVTDEKYTFGRKLNIILMLTKALKSGSSVLMSTDLNIVILSTFVKEKTQDYILFILKNGLKHFNFC